MPTGSRMILVIETFQPWSEKAVEELATEFNRLYDGNFAIRSAWLDSVSEYEYKDESEFDDPYDPEVP